jgi:hypothetical protein
LSFETYSRKNIFGEVLYHTSREFFLPLQGEEKYRTEGFKEIALIYGTAEESFRKTAALINRIRHQEVGGTPFRTIREPTECEGTLLQAHLEEKVNLIFQANRFTPAGHPQDGIWDTESLNTPLSEKELKELLIDPDLPEAWITDMLSNPVAYEAPQDAVAISLDDVGAKKQKESREQAAHAPPGEKKRAYVQHTVIHVEQGGRSYLLNGHGVMWVLRLLLAFLLRNKLLGKTLVFFVDGHALYSSVLEYFSWYTNKTVILDWYHLHKKCKELLSMALNGRDIRNAVLKNLMPLLWHGLVDQAIAYLKSLPESEIKNEDERIHLVQYLAKNRPMIPVYAVRRELGLRNSSNRGEKANDLLVAERQKHNGMSWSLSGSVALASVTALKHNREYLKWFRERKIAFTLPS